MRKPITKPIVTFSKIFKDFVAMWACRTSLNNKSPKGNSSCSESFCDSSTVECPTFPCCDLATIWNHQPPNVTGQHSPTACLHNQWRYISKSSFYLHPNQNEKWGNVKWNRKTCFFSKFLTAHWFARVPLWRIQNKKAAHCRCVTINDVINVASWPFSKRISILFFFSLPHSFKVSKKDKRMILSNFVKVKKRNGSKENMDYLPAS